MSQSNQDSVSAYANPASSVQDDAIVDEEITDLENPGAQNKYSDTAMEVNQEVIDTTPK